MNLKWGEFEAMGFWGWDSREKELQFDLEESVQTVRLISSLLLCFSYLPHRVARATQCDAPVQQPLS
jgi:hypothetical protein